MIYLEQFHVAKCLLAGIVFKSFNSLMYSVLNKINKSIDFYRLIPSYHLHFGRQCRVADYGFTRLADLLESLNHTVQV